MFEVAGNDISASLRGTKQSVPNIKINSSWRGSH